MVTTYDDVTMEDSLGILKRAIESEDSWTRAINGILLNKIVHDIHDRMLNDPIFPTIYNTGNNTALKIIASVYVNRRNLPSLSLTDDDFEILLPESNAAIEAWNNIVNDSNVDEVTKNASYIGGDVPSLVKGVEMMLFDELYIGVRDRLIKEGYVEKKNPFTAQTEKKDVEKEKPVDSTPVQLPIPSTTPVVVVDGEFKEITKPLDGTLKSIYQETVPEIVANNNEWVAKFQKLEKLIYYAHKANKSIMFSQVNTTNKDLANDVISVSIHPAGDITKTERFLMIDYDNIYHNDVNLIQNSDNQQNIYRETVIPMCDGKAIIRMIEGKTTDEDISHQKVNEDWVKDIFSQIDFGTLKSITFKEWNDLLHSLSKCTKYLQKKVRYRISKYESPNKFKLVADSNVKQYYTTDKKEMYVTNTSDDIPCIDFDPKKYKTKSFEVGIFKISDTVPELQNS